MKDLYITFRYHQLIFFFSFWVNVIFKTRNCTFCLSKGVWFNFIMTIEGDAGCALPLNCATGTNHIDKRKPYTFSFWVNQVTYYYLFLSVVVLRICRTFVGCKLLNFFLLWNHWTNFIQNWHIAFMSKGEFQLWNSLSLPVWGLKCRAKTININAPGHQAAKLLAWL